VNVHLNVHLVFGIRPLETNKPLSLEVLEDMLEQPKCVGVGECGLDTSREQCEGEKEEVQLKLARETLTFVIHIRRRNEKEQNELQMKAIGII